MYCKLLIILYTTAYTCPGYVIIIYNVFPATLLPRTHFNCGLRSYTRITRIAIYKRSYVLNHFILIYNKTTQGNNQLIRIEQDRCRIFVIEFPRRFILKGHVICHKRAIWIPSLVFSFHVDIRWWRACNEGTIFQRNGQIFICRSIERWDKLKRCTKLRPTANLLSYWVTSWPGN